MEVASFQNRASLSSVTVGMLSLFKFNYDHALEKLLNADRNI